jgi:RNA polymerase sigma factor (sigma-70 family)
VLLKALQKFDSFRGDAKIGTWLYSIARNLHIDGVRARVTRAEVSLGIAEPAVRAFFPDAVERHDIRRQLNKTIRRSLTEMEIRILVLHYAQGVPLTKITKMLELRNRSGAKAYLVSGRRKLARALKNKLRLRV